MHPASCLNYFVDNQTIAAGQFARSQQFRSAGVAADGQAFDLEPEFEGVSNREVIADDDHDKAGVRQFLLTCHWFGCACGRGSAALDGKKQQMKSAVLMCLKFAKPAARTWPRSLHSTERLRGLCEHFL